MCSIIKLENLKTDRKVTDGERRRFCGGQVISRALVYHMLLYNNVLGAPDNVSVFITAAADEGRRGEGRRANFWIARRRRGGRKNAPFAIVRKKKKTPPFRNRERRCRRKTAARPTARSPRTRKKKFNLTEFGSWFFLFCFLVDRGTLGPVTDRYPSRGMFMIAVRPVDAFFFASHKDGHSADDDDDDRAEP